MFSSHTQSHLHIFSWQCVSLPTLCVVIYTCTVNISLVLSMESVEGESAPRACITAHIVTQSEIQQGMIIFTQFTWTRVQTLIWEITSLSLSGSFGVIVLATLVHCPPEGLSFQPYISCVWGVQSLLYLKSCWIDCYHLYSSRLFHTRACAYRFVRLALRLRKRL